MAMHLGSECSGDILRTVHNLSTLIVQAHDAGAFLHRFQRRGAFFLLADPPGALGRLRTEPRREPTGIPLACLSSASRKRGMHILCQEAIPISFGDNVAGNEGLLLHTRLGTYATLTACRSRTSSRWLAANATDLPKAGW